MGTNLRAIVLDENRKIEELKTTMKNTVEQCNVTKDKRVKKMLKNVGSRHFIQKNKKTTITRVIQDLKHILHVLNNRIELVKQYKTLVNHIFENQRLPPVYETQDLNNAIQNLNKASQDITKITNTNLLEHALQGAKAQDFYSSKRTTSDTLQKHLERDATDAALKILIDTALEHIMVHEISRDIDRAQRDLTSNVNALCNMTAEELDDLNYRARVPRRTILQTLRSRISTFRNRNRNRRRTSSGKSKRVHTKKRTHASKHSRKHSRKHSH